MNASQCYTLDSKLAREGSGGVGGRIRETGKYLGIIEWAREVTFDSGAIAIEIKFKSCDDQTANMKMFVHTPNGTGTSFGMKQLNALMTCVKVKQINKSNGSCEVYDFDTKAMKQEQSVVFKELENKPIGLILQKEYYQYNGQMKDQINLFAPFSSDKEQTAKEILDNKGETGTVDKILESLKDKYRDNVKPINGGSPDYGQPPAHLNEAPPFDDSDIPF